MKELLIIAIGSALVNNVVLSQFLGICPFLGVSKKVETAAGMGGAVVFVITNCIFCNRCYLQIYSGQSRNPGRKAGLSADHSFHPRYCLSGSVC